MCQIITFAWCKAPNAPSKPPDEEVKDCLHKQQLDAQLEQGDRTALGALQHHRKGMHLILMGFSSQEQNINIYVVTRKACKNAPIVVKHVKDPLPDGTCIPDMRKSIAFKHQSISGQSPPVGKDV